MLAERTYCIRKQHFLKMVDNMKFFVETQIIVASASTIV